MLLAFAPATFAGTGGVNGSVYVNGQGIVSVKPDTAVVSINIESRASTSKEAQQKNESVSKNLISEITKLGVPAKDIQTSWYNIFPEYDYNDPYSRRVISYIANHSLNITIRNLEDVSNVVDKVTEFENITLNGVNYTLENKTAAMDEARELAIKNAKEKITKLANLLGFSLGTLIGVSENSGYDYYGPTMSYDMRGNAQNVMVNVAVDVSLNYEIR